MSKDFFKTVVMAASVRRTEARKRELCQQDPAVNAGDQLEEGKRKLREHAERQDFNRALTHLKALISGERPLGQTVFMQTNALATVVCSPLAEQGAATVVAFMEKHPDGVYVHDVQDTIHRYRSSRNQTLVTAAEKVAKVFVDRLFQYEPINGNEKEIQQHFHWVAKGALAAMSGLMSKTREFVNFCEIVPESFSEQFLKDEALLRLFEACRSREKYSRPRPSPKKEGLPAQLFSKGPVLDDSVDYEDVTPEEIEAGKVSADSGRSDSENWDGEEEEIPATPDPGSFSGKLSGAIGASSIKLRPAPAQPVASIPAPPPPAPAPAAPAAVEVTSAPLAPPPSVPPAPAPIPPAPVQTAASEEEQKGVGILLANLPRLSEMDEEQLAKVFATVRGWTPGSICGVYEFFKAKGLEHLFPKDLAFTLMFMGSAAGAASEAKAPEQPAPAQPAPPTPAPPPPAPAPAAPVASVPSTLPSIDYLPRGQWDGRRLDPAQQMLWNALSVVIENGTADQDEINDYNDLVLVGCGYRSRKAL